MNHLGSSRYPLPKSHLIARNPRTTTEPPRNPLQIREIRRLDYVSALRLTSRRSPVRARHRPLTKVLQRPHFVSARKYLSRARVKQGESNWIDRGRRSPTGGAVTGLRLVAVRRRFWTDLATGADRALHGRSADKEEVPGSSPGSPTFRMRRARRRPDSAPVFCGRFPGRCAIVERGWHSQAQSAKTSSIEPPSEAASHEA